MDRFNIGDFCFCWDGGGYELLKGEYFEKFRITASENMEEIRFQGRFLDLKPYDKFKRILENYTYELLDVDGERLLIYHWAWCRLAFAIWPDRIKRDEVTTCYFNPEMLNNNIMKADWFFGLSGLHRALLQRNAPIIHASYIDYKGQAILFTAPSKTGKSTQAQLWEKYGGAEIINGDRVLLREKNDGWYAYGYPCCGSSDICINRTLPIRAIVILRQGNENKVEELSEAEKVRALVAGVEAYRWDLQDIDLALELAGQIVKSVQIVQLMCKPDSDAVRVLQKYLEN